MSNDHITRDELLQQVIASFDDAPNERLKTVMQAAAKHLHAFVSEVEPDIDEWGVAIDFLTRTGQMCTDTRQEFIMLSDTMGISMLVETINDEETPEATDSTVLGPFHVTVSPDRDMGDDMSPDSDGDKCLIRGKVLGSDGLPVEGAKIDVWQADTLGFYDVQKPETQSPGNGRGLFTTGPDGDFWFRTVVPAPYPIPTDGPVGEMLLGTDRHPYRPAHVHFLVTAPGYRQLTTHIFVDGSEYVDSDAVFAVKPSLVKKFDETDDAALAEQHGLPNPFRLADFDIVLHKEDGAGGA